MQVVIWVLILSITLVPGLSISAFAQNAAVAPIYIDRAIYNAAQEGFICSKETIESLDLSEREARIKVCGLNLNIENNEAQASTAELDTQAFATEPNSSTVVNNEGEEVSILPNPEVEFVEEYVMKFDGNKSKDTIFYGGVVPFVALPDSQLATEDSFFNEESFSVFFYLKRKF